MTRARRVASDCDYEQRPIEGADIEEAGRDLLDGAERAAQLFSLCC
jgi:hypothetical protein